MRYSYIDALRGFAILGVMAVHVSLFAGVTGFAKDFVEWGQMGVQLFFVVSALTLCLSIERKPVNKISIRNFYLRRLFRIAPMYYVGILMYGLINYYQYKTNTPNAYQYYTPAGILSNVLFVHGFVPKYNNTIVPGGWSIGTEMAFYVIFPYLYLFLAGKSIRFMSRLLIIYFVAGTVAAYLLTRITHKVVVNDSFVYFNLLNQLPVFLWGILLFKILKRTEVVSGITIALLLIAGGAGFLLSWYKGDIFFFFFVPFFSAMAFVAITLYLSKINIQLHWVKRIGQLSYSIYILHFLFCILVAYGIKQLSFMNGLGNELRFLVSYILVLLLTVIAAQFSEKYFENKCIALGSRVIKRLEARDETT